MVILARFGGGDGVVVVVVALLNEVLVPIGGLVLVCMQLFCRSEVVATGNVVRVVVVVVADAVVSADVEELFNFLTTITIFDRRGLFEVDVDVEVVADNGNSCDDGDDVSVAAVERVLLAVVVAVALLLLEIFRLLHANFVVAPLKLVSKAEGNVVS